MWAIFNNLLRQNRRRSNLRGGKVKTRGERQKKSKQLSSERYRQAYQLIDRSKSRRVAPRSNNSGVSLQAAAAAADDAPPDYNDYNDDYMDDDYYDEAPPSPPSEPEVEERRSSNKQKKKKKKKKKKSRKSRKSQRRLPFL